MNSKDRQDAQAIVRRIEEALNEERVQRLIDEPIDRVLDHFRIPPEEPFSVSFVHRVIADFVRELFRNGVRMKRNLTQSQALAEALEILQGYRGLGGQGYGAALRDAKQEGEAGLGHVIEQMGESVKARQRRRYERWVLASNLDASDWDAKCRLVKHLIEMNARSLPDDIANCPPAQLAGCWPDLLLLHVQLARLPTEETSMPNLSAYG